MTHSLDHAVHAVRDLDSAAELYRQLGFTVGARNRHPWGTHNHIIQLPGFFIELLMLVEPDKLGSDGFSTLFATYTRDFVARHEGLALLILESQDAGADAAAYNAAGIAASDKLRFERDGKRPDGKPVKVGFSLAFAHDINAPDIQFATCQQHFPENFWDPDFQKHDNGAAGIAGVVLVAEKPARHREFMLAFTAASGADEDGNGYRLDLPRGVVDVMTPAAFTLRFGLAAPSAAQGPRMAALRIAVADTAAVKSSLRQAGIALATAGATPASTGAAVFNPDSGAVSVPLLGAVLIFECGR